MSIARLPILVLFAVAGCVPAAQALAPPRERGPGRASPSVDPSVPYDHAVQSSAHNAFEREEPLLDQLVYDRIRSLELDIHASRAGQAAPPNDWFVYHEDIDLPGNRDSSCTLLSDCLRLVSAFHNAVPHHEVVTLWLDLKDAFIDGHSIED